MKASKWGSHGLESRERLNRPRHLLAKEEIDSTALPKLYIE